jgi:hypothetical protein
VFLRAGVVVVMLLVVGCASPGPVVESRATAPPTAGAFRISSLRPEAPPVSERLVADALKARGLRPAADGEAADYAVQVTFADHAPMTGAFVPAVSGEPVWRVTGEKRRFLDLRPPKGAYALGVQIVEAGSGREAYVARVRQTYRKAAPDTDLPGLVAAALNHLPAKP